jgi:hypothetical protein
LLTNEKAEEIYNELKVNQEACDGDGKAKIGQKHGVGFGKNFKDGSERGFGQGKGKNRGQGRGNGMGQGRGQGNGFSR